jgi:hypothetical protein
MDSFFFIDERMPAPTRQLAGFAVRPSVGERSRDGFDDLLAILEQAVPVFGGHLQPLRDAVPACIEPFRNRSACGHFLPQFGPKFDFRLPAGCPPAGKLLICVAQLLLQAHQGVRLLFFPNCKNCPSPASRFPAFSPVLPVMAILRRFDYR